jgi:uridine phosphorylase
MSIVLVGSTSGSITLQEPAIAGSSTINLPVGTGTAVVNNVNSAIVAGTAVNASGTSVDFTSIPSWVKRITVNMQQVSTNGASAYLIQIGTSSGIQSTGYVSCFVYTGPGSSGSGTTQGFGIYSDGDPAVKDGSVMISLLNAANGTWAANGVFAQGPGSVSPGYYMPCAGSKTLSGTLDRVRITTVNGTDTFDLGSINILYE